MDGLLLGVATHLLARPQGAANSGPLWQPEQAAPVVFIELGAPNTRWFSRKHAGYGAGNRGRNAAGATSWAAVHGGTFVLLKYLFKMSK